MAKKKSLFKKIFGKSKQSKDEKIPPTPSGGVANTEETTSPVKPALPIAAAPTAMDAAVEEHATPPTIPQANACDTTLDTEADDDCGSPRPAAKEKVEVESESPEMADDAPTHKSDQGNDLQISNDDVPSKPDGADDMISAMEDVAGAGAGACIDANADVDADSAEENVVETVDTKAADTTLEENAATKDGAEKENAAETVDTKAADATPEESVATKDGAETIAITLSGVALDKDVTELIGSVSSKAKADKQATGEGDEDAEVDKKDTGVEKGDTDNSGVEKGDAENHNKAETKDRRSWAEQRMSQMYASSSKTVEKSKVEVEVIGKLSDRMKAVEEALHKEQGKGPNSPSKEASFSHTINREKAAAQRKAIEDRLKRKSDPKVSLHGKSTSNSPPGKISSQRKIVEEMLQKELDPKAFLDEKATPSSQPGKVSSQRKVVEEMLQKELDPQAFLDSQGKANPQSPGKERLASQKKWVMETLEKQNDPKSFVDQKERHFVDMSHENFGQKKDFEEHKKWLEGMAHVDEKEKKKVVEENALSATC